MAAHFSLLLHIREEEDLGLPVKHDPPEGLLGEHMHLLRLFLGLVLCGWLLTLKVKRPRHSSADTERGCKDTCPRPREA